MSLPKFTWTPKRRKIVEDRYRTLKTKMESGRIQYRSKGKRPRIFELEFDKQNMTKNEPHEIVEFFKARQGMAEPFNLDVKDEEGNTEEVKVHFATDVLTKEITADTVYRFSLTFEESLW